MCLYWKTREHFAYSIRRFAKKSRMTHTGRIRKIICLLAVAVCITAAGPSVSAQKPVNVPYFETPWTVEETNGTTVAVPPSYRSTNKRAPDRPVITPTHTKQLIAYLQGEAEKEIPSPLEQSYSSRIVDQLTQFGYDMFGSTDIETATTKSKAKDFSLPAGAVQDDFVLGIGDELDITFRGSIKIRETYRIDNQGLLVIEDFPPIPAAGRNIGQIRSILEDHAHTVPNTNVYVSLAAVKQINVLIAGHVKKPGARDLTVFHSVLDALMNAGGVKKTGSLRRIKLIRNGRSTIIDLYSLLVYGSDTMDLHLRDGDRIIVPPIGPSVAIAGNVKRPGIYEILPALRGSLHKPQESSQKLSLEELLGYAGGVMTPGQNRFLKLGLTNDGRETVDDISDSYRRVFGSGSILMVSPSKEHRSGMVELVGETNRPGLHDLSAAPTLSKLIDNRNVFGPDIYPLLGVIERWDETQLTRKLIPFPPLLVLNGGFDRKLQDGDVIHMLARDKILAFGDEDNKINFDADNNNNREYEYENAKTDHQYEVGSAELGPQDDILNDRAVRSLLSERSAYIRGAVRHEGAYPVAEGITLENLLAVAGGMTLEASSNDIEITSKSLGEGHQKDGRSGTLRKNINLAEIAANEIMIGAGDTVRVNQKFRKIADNSVLIIGEVKRPGRYDLLPGDTMADLLERAGGLTAQAYPDGAVFSRDSERRAEKARYRAEARELEVTLASAIQDDKDKPDLTAITAVQDVITQLKHAEAVGRITVETDPTVLAANRELDILLEAKDRIYIPKRPLTVRVMGEVLSPASLQFRSEKSARDYIAEAGGFSYHADKDRTFVLYPDGSAQPLQVGAWNHKNTFIPPGSAVIIPRDPKPFDFLQTTRDVTQILANLAFSAVVIDDIRNN